MTEAEERSWMARNWKWFVPVGCLGMIALGLAAVTGLFFLIMGGLRSTDVFEDAVTTARSNPQLIQAIGKPIEPGVLITGSYSLSGSGGEANLETHLSGPEGGARLFIRASKTSGVWTYETLRVVVEEDQGAIDLLSP